jgi:UDP-N-acetylglucosamine--N-acetylmuramyl-(pentapeptide) pyrophosphoryl-undecaprenol N-acetylglucosamine transferase
VIFTTGGYLSVPVAMASRDVPIGCFVPDIEPGLALRFVSIRAAMIAITTEASRQFFHHPERVRVTGYPVREALTPIPKDEAVKEFDLDPAKAVLLVFGGSRGARSINEALWENLGALLSRCQIIHITGSLDWPRVETVQSLLPEGSVQNYRPYPYLHSEMGTAMSAADLVLSRAGAATLGEFPHFGLPAILVPYPHAWRYQRTNASHLENKGAAVVLNDEDLKTRLLPLVTILLDDAERLAEMGRSARALQQTGAAEKIARELEKIMRKEA